MSSILLLQCCFTSAETVRTGTGAAQDVHPDFHTAPELRGVSSMLLYVRRHYKACLGTGSLGLPPRLSHSSWAVLCKALKRALSKGTAVGEHLVFCITMGLSRRPPVHSIHREFMWLKHECGCYLHWGVNTDSIYTRTGKCNHLHATNPVRNLHNNNHSQNSGNPPGRTDCAECTRMV